MSRHLYIIHCLDDLSSEFVDKGVRFGATQKRLAAYADHKAYLATTNDPSLPTYIKKIAAGPMESEDGKYMIGSCFIVEATRAEAEAFNQNDPFYKTGVWGQVCYLFPFDSDNIMLYYIDIH